MCGRFALTVTPELLKKVFGYEELPNFPPLTNISPTQPVVTITQDHQKRHFQLMRWGFIPSWVKDPADFPLLFNARSETVSEKPAFRTVIRHRRCLIPASGFYEWLNDGKVKVPFLIAMKDRSPLALAGIWETYSGGDGSEIDTVAIITTSANAEVAPLHNRMPAIILPPDFSLWLDSSAPNLMEAVSLLRSAPDGLLEIEPCDPVKGPLTLEKHPLKRPKDQNKTRKSDQFDLF